MHDIPASPDCFWTITAPATDYPALSGDRLCDAVVVGGGIVGLTTALALLESGKSVVALEARSMGRQVTGRSTAKITTQHGLIYGDLAATLGHDSALAYAAANRAGAARIASWIEALGIACDYERKSAYAYARSEDGRLAIEREAAAARSVGLEAWTRERAPLPFATCAALEFPDQAQFDPARYLIGLAAAAHAQGAQLYEQSRATAFDRSSECWRVGTDGGTVEAAKVVIATNIPVKSPAGYASRTQPRCHVVMAYRQRNGTDIDGMFLGIDPPAYSIRTAHDEHGDVVIVVGPRFNTGQEGDVALRFRDLDRWTRAHLPVGDALWRWCNEDYDTPHRVPYVGQPDADEAPGFYVATGFNAWGITNGTAAGLTIASDIAGRSCPWGNLYDPTRQAPDDFHHSGDSRSLVPDVQDIARGEGGVITRGDEKIAVCRDDDGTLHAVSAACTHKGCTVTWNNADRTWDCPCHGSIFEANGAVVHGPARKALAPRSM